jgi:hypothetical protein
VRRGLPLLALALLALPVRAAAQGVSLELRPKVGDTLTVRIDQEVEMVGTTRVASGDSVVRVTNGMHVVSRAVVERSDAAGTTMLAMTDSVSLTSSNAPSRALKEARQALVGQQVRVRVAPDGATELLGDDVGREDLRELFAQMPATLPREKVAVGDRWTREMPLPPPGGTVKAIFRLDSLSRRGEVAWVSMTGAITRDSVAEPRTGATVRMTGRVTGTLTVDRARGWLTSSRTTIVVNSTMTPPAGAKGAPARFRMRVTQWMRTEDR